MRTPEKISAWRKAWRARRKQVGGCIDCTAKAEPGKRQCIDHLDVNRKQSARVRRQHFIAGLCMKCRQPRVRGRTQCQRHLDMCKAFSTKMRAAAKPLPEPVCLECGTSRPMTGSVLCWCCLNPPARVST